MAIDSKELKEFLRNLPLFSEVGALTMRRIFNEMDSRKLKAGETLFEAGDAPDGLYVVLYGRLRATKYIPIPQMQGAGHTIHVADFGREEIFGELSLITGEPRSSTVHAIRDSLVLRLSVKGFRHLSKSDPLAIIHLMQDIVKRSQKLPGNNLTQPKIRSLGIIPLGNPADCARFTRDLAVNFSHYCRVSVIDGPAGALSAQTGPRAAESAQLIQRLPADLAQQDSDGLISWLHAQEEQQDLTIYYADSYPSDWTSLCARQSDRLLLVDNSGPYPTQGRMVDWLNNGQGLSSRAQRDLVLLHPRLVEPRNSQQWIDHLPVDRHHHIRLGNHQDIGRLARHLTGRAVGLVLAGGGARGFAHIGVLQALADAKIPVDVIGGASMGGLIAGLFALEKSIGEITDSLAALFHPGKVNDYGLPMISIIRGRKIHRTMLELFGDYHIEDLFHRFFCVSTSLTHNELRVHTQGRMVDWITAGMAVPGLLPPFFNNGDILVDGAVLNNLPADIMRQQCDGRVIGVDIRSEMELRGPDDLHGWPDPHDLVVGNPGLRRAYRDGKIPSIYETIMACVSISSTYHRALLTSNIDHLIEIPTENIRLTDWGKIDIAIQRGYETAVEAIAQWSIDLPEAHSQPGDRLDIWQSCAPARPRTPESIIDNSPLLPEPHSHLPEPSNP